MLLDNSYSMRYGKNFDKMKSEALSRIDALGGSDRMAIVAFQRQRDRPGASDLRQRKAEGGR